MKNRELVIRSFMHQVFLAIFKNILPPIKDKLPFHQTTPSIMSPPLYCILEEPSTP